MTHLLASSWPQLALGLALVCLGLAVWLGPPKAYVLRAWPSPTMHLAPLWIGLAVLLMTVAQATPRAVAATLAALAGLLFLAGLLAVVWSPRVLQPRWLRDAPAWKDPHDHR